MTHTNTSHNRLAVGSINRIWTLYRHGMTMQQIAVRIGKDYDTIWGIIHLRRYYEISRTWLQSNDLLAIDGNLMSAR